MQPSPFPPVLTLTMKTFLKLLALSLTFLTCAQQNPSTNPLRPPIPGIPTVVPSEVGFNVDSLTRLVELIGSTPPRDFRGLVVIKDHKLVVEEYFNTYWRASIHDIRSAGKSVTALLLGVAMKEGLVKNLDQSVYSFFSVSEYPNLNEDYEKISLRDLMNMASGIDADTDDSETPGMAVHWIGRDDWLEYILSVPMARDPGEQWVYADINAVLIGAVIEKVSGMSVKDYAEEKLFRPLGISQYYWFTNASNQTGAAGNLFLSTLDFAKIGLLVLNNGMWKNQQLIDPALLAEIKEKNFDLSATNPYADHYGGFWWKSTRQFGDHEVEYLFASGNGGNVLVVIPDQNMVVALTSSAYGPGPGHQRTYNILSQVVAALEE